MLSKFTKKDDWDSRISGRGRGASVLHPGRGKSKDPGKPHPARPLC